MATMAIVSRSIWVGKTFRVFGAQKQQKSHEFSKMLSKTLTERGQSYRLGINVRLKRVHKDPVFKSVGLPRNFTFWANSAEPCHSNLTCAMAMLCQLLLRLRQVKPSPLAVTEGQDTAARAVTTHVQHWLPFLANLNPETSLR